MQTPELTTLVRFMLVVAVLAAAVAVVVTAEANAQEYDILTKCALALRRSCKAAMAAA